MKKYRDDCAAFAKWRKSKNALTVTAAERKAWIEAMQDEGKIGNRTVKVKFQNLRTGLNWGRQNDPQTFFPAGNPLNGIPPDYTTIPSYLRAFTMEEAKLLTAARKEDRAMFRWISIHRNSAHPVFPRLRTGIVRAGSYRPCCDP